MIEIPPVERDAKEPHPNHFPRDLLPLVTKGSREEQVRLAKLALRAASDLSRDAARARQRRSSPTSSRRVKRVRIGRDGWTGSCAAVNPFIHSYRT